MFALYINDLVAELNMGSTCYAFADDLVIIAKGEMELDLAIDKIERWSTRNGIEVNKAKSGIIQVRKDRRTPNPLIQTRRGYPFVDEYKYLGVMIDNALNMKAELRQKKFLDHQLVA